MRIKDINIKTRLFSVSTLLFLISLVTIVLLYIRITATISLGDETINVAVAYKMTQGFRPFVDMWELYQIGDLIWLPFLMLFVKISGGTTGIILFSRLLYLAMNIGLLICCAVVLKKKLGKIKAVFVGLILMCYAPFCLYYNWYDTEMIFFGFLGTVLLLGGLDYRGRKQKILMVASGVAYGCMVVSYPSIAITIPFIGVGLIITNILRKKKQSGCMHSIPIGYIILGGFVLVGGILMYLALQGAKDWFLFDKTISDAVFARKDYSFSFETIRSMTQYGVDVIKNYYGTIALVTLSTYIIGIIIQNKVIRCTVVIEILILPIILLYNRTLPLDDLDNLYYLFYITIWTIPLIAYIPKCKRREVIDLWVITIPASIAGYFAVGYTSDNGALKSPMGVPFVVVTALIMFSYIIADKNDENETKGKLVNISRKKACQVVCEFVLILGVCFELITFYSRSFWYANYSDCNTVFTEGPYKGLRATDGDVARLESLYHFWNENVSDDDTHGIVVTDGGLLPFYLFNNQYMATFEFEWLPYRGSGEGQDWTLSKLYWNKVSGYPEYIITSEANGANGNFKDEFEEQYSLVSTYKDVHMYKKR